MADNNKNQTELDKPKGVGAIQAEETEIHVIPEEFYGATTGIKPQKKSVEPPPSQPPTKIPPKNTEAPKKHKKNSGAKWIIGIVIILLLLAIAGGAYYFLVYSKGKVVCGDGTCQSSESYETCPEDCQPPAPRCGDNKCDSNENYENCPEDCEAPEVVCGDGKCDDDESYENCPQDCRQPDPVCGDDICEHMRGESYSECPEDCEPPPAEQSKDTDSDGLTDIEEIEIYGSNPNRVDSDGDGFVDLNEVLNLFDPSTPDPAPLVGNRGISEYTNIDFGIELLRPTRWQSRDIPAERSIVFTSTTGEQVRVTTYNKDENQGIIDWLQDAPISEQIDIEQVEVSKHKFGSEMLITANRQIIFVSNGKTVVGISYLLNEALEIRYRVTVSMMANSVKFIERSTEQSENPVENVPALPISDGSGNEE